MEGRIDVRALVLGVLGHMATALTVGLLAGLALYGPLLSRFFQSMMATASSGKPMTPAQTTQLSNQMQVELQSAMTTPPALIISIAVGVLALLVGGYVTANYARGAEQKNALALGGAYAVYNLLTLTLYLSVPASRAGMPLWPQIVLMLLAIPVTLAGAALRVSGRREEGAPPTDNIT
jgi:cytochrome bd-type quinol oxidase subunit 2